MYTSVIDMMKGNEVLFYINIHIKLDYQQKAMSSMSDLSKLDVLLHETRGGGGG